MAKPTPPYARAKRDANTPPTKKGSSDRLPAVLPPEVTSAPESAKFGKYVRVARLGVGGAGEVWKAWDFDLSRWVALKLLRTGDDDEILRFKREAQVAAKLTHPNIAAIYEVGEAQERPFIAMQFIDGRTLKNFPRTDLRLIARLVRDAARAVAFAHDQGIVHRDLKPDNLMVAAGPRTPGGRRDAEHHVFVLDFGLAKPMTSSDLSATGSIVGTPSYMPPEQASGGHADTRSDVYALGSTLYALVTGRPPFDGATLLEILRKVQDESPRPLRRLNPRIPADLETIVYTCLEKDPDRRYATAAELAEDLTRFLNGEPIVARAPSIAYRLRRTLARHKLAIGIAAIVVAVVAGVLVWRSREHEILDRRAAELDARAAKDDVLKLVELGRAPLDQARELLYRREASYDELVSRIDASQRALEKIELPVAHYLSGIGWELKADSERAEAAFRQAIAKDPAFSPARFRLGRLLVQRGYLVGIAVSGDVEMLRRRSREIHAEAKREFDAAREFDDDVQRAVAAAMARYAAGEHDAAFDEARAAAEKFRGRPGEEELCWAAGTAARPGEQEPWFDRAITIRPQFPLALFQRSLIRGNRGNLPGAIEDCTAAVRFAPRFLEAWYNRSVLRWLSKDVEGSMADSTEVIKLDPSHGLAYNNRGVGRDLRGDTEGALTDFAEAARLMPTVATPRLARASIYQKKNQNRACIAEAEEALRIDANAPYGYLLRGIGRLRLNELDDARADFDKAIELQPGYCEAYANRAQVKKLQNDREGAAADLRRCLQVAPRGWAERTEVEQMLKDLESE